MVIKQSPIFLTYKPGKGFDNTIKILNQIRRDIISNIGKSEGDYQVPSLCPINFFFENQQSGCLHNISDVSYQDLLLAPDLNELILLISKEISVNKTLKVELLDEWKNKLRTIWGNWEDFNSEDCLTSVEHLRYFFDDISIEYKSEISSLEKLIDEISDHLVIQNHIAELAKSIIKSRNNRYKAFIELRDTVMGLGETRRIEINNGIRLHPIHFNGSSATPIAEHDQTALDMIIDHFTEAKKIGSIMDLLNSIINVFLNLAQEVYSSKAYIRLKYNCVKEYAVRSDYRTIVLNDLIIFERNFEPIDEDDIKKFTHYSLLSYFEKIFYGSQEKVDYIVYVPIRPFPCSGIVIGYGVTINSNPPNLRAIIDSYSLYESRVSQSLILDTFNYAIDQVINFDHVNNDIVIVGKSLNRFLPIKASLIMTDKIDFAFANLNRDQQVGKFAEFDGGDKETLNRFLQTIEESNVLDINLFRNDKQPTALFNFFNKEDKERIDRSNNIICTIISYPELLNELGVPRERIIGNKTMSFLVVIIGNKALENIETNHIDSNYYFILLFENLIDEHNIYYKEEVIDFDKRNNFTNFLRPAAIEISTIIANLLSIVLSKKKALKRYYNEKDTILEVSKTIPELKSSYEAVRTTMVNHGLEINESMIPVTTFLSELIHIILANENYLPRPIPTIKQFVDYRIAFEHIASRVIQRHKLNGWKDLIQRLQEILYKGEG